MSQAIFQTGMSWKMVEGKWHEIREAFEGFSIKRVASFTDDDLDRLAADRRVICNRRKLAAIIHNAKQILEKDKEYPSFQEYLRLNDDFDKTLAALRKDSAGKIIVDRRRRMAVWTVNNTGRTYRHGRKEILRRAVRSAGGWIVQQIQPSSDVVLAQRGQFIKFRPDTLPGPMQRVGRHGCRINKALVGHEERTCLGQLEGPKGTCTLRASLCFRLLLRPLDQCRVVINNVHIHLFE